MDGRRGAVVDRVARGGLVRVPHGVLDVQVDDAAAVGGLEGLRDGEHAVEGRVRRPRAGAARDSVRRVEEVVGDAALAGVEVRAGVALRRHLEGVVARPHRDPERVGDAVDAAAGDAVELVHQHGLLLLGGDLETMILPQGEANGVGVDDVVFDAKGRVSFAVVLGVVLEGDILELLRVLAQPVRLQYGGQVLRSHNGANKRIVV